MKTLPSLVAVLAFGIPCFAAGPEAAGSKFTDWSTPTNVSSVNTSFGESAPAISKNGLSLYFASQGSGKVLAPVLAGTVRLWVVAVGGWWLTVSDAPAWSLFALVGASMTAFGFCIAVAVYLTPWAVRATPMAIKPRVDPPVSDSRCTS